MTDPIRFDVKPTLCNGVGVVSVVGELDCETGPRLNEVLASLAAPGRVILIDLSETAFIDCAGVAPLVAAHRRQRELGGDVILDSPRGEVTKVIEWTQLDRFIRVVERT